MRLIDADEIRWVDHYDSDGNLSKYKVAYSDEMPPTVDAVPVIRCKDCKHWQCDDNESYCDELGIFNTDMNSYCSYAKRKEE